jgi:diguanylate cyclase (GGDEF)-like protein
MRRLLSQIADRVGVALEREVARRQAEIDRAELYRQATHDPMTSLHNRMYLWDVADQICAVDDRNVEPSVAVLMIDVDHFKRVNDTFGHATGDEVLRRVGAAIRGATRAGDVPIRFGGDEFLVLLSGVTADEAHAVAERIRCAVGASTGAGPAVTVSVGVAMRRWGEPHEALVRRADRALYRAKAEGRDTTSVAS